MMNESTENFLFSLDGLEFLIACCLARGLSVRKMARLLRKSSRDIIAVKKKLREDWEDFVSHGQEEEEVVEKEEAWEELYAQEAERIPVRSIW